MTKMNCSAVIHKLFYEGIAHVDEMDIVSAAKYLCDHLLRVFGASTRPNTTQPAIQNDFQKSCCNDSSFSDLCDYANVLFNLTASLNCTFPEPQSQLTSIVVENNRYDVMTYILMSILFPLGVTGNLLILYAVMRMKCLPFQTGYFLCSLALADIGVIVEFLAFFIYHHNDSYVPDRVHKYLMPSLDMLFGSISLLQITCISIERAVAVTWPLKYQSLMSVRRAKLTVVFIWCFSFALFFMALLRIWIYSLVYASIIFYTAASVLLILPMVVVTVAYTFVVASAYQNISVERQRMKMLTCLFRSDDVLLGENNESNGNKSKSLAWRQSSIRCKEIKLSVNVAIVVLPFLGCWGFFVFAHVYEVISNYRFEGLSNWLILILPFIVSCMNPFLYTMCTRSLRNSLKSMIQRNARRLSRTELTFTSRRSSSITVVTNVGRRIGRVSLEILEGEDHFFKKLFPPSRTNVVCSPMSDSSMDGLSKTTEAEKKTLSN